MVLRFRRGELDEVIAEKVSLHVERMGKREWAVVVDEGDSQQYILYVIGEIILADVEGATVDKTD